MKQGFNFQRLPRVDLNKKVADSGKIEDPRTLFEFWTKDLHDKHSEDYADIMRNPSQQSIISDGYVAAEEEGGVIWGNEGDEPVDLWDKEVYLNPGEKQPATKRFAARAAKVPNPQMLPGWQEYLVSLCSDWSSSQEGSQEAAG